MKIPKSFKLAGVTWKVVQQKDSYNLGLCERDKALITLRKNVGPITTKEIALLHELVHAIKYTQGDFGPHDEKEVDALAHFLHQFMTTQK